MTRMARGNRRQPTFFEEADYVYYRTVLAEECQRYGVEIWAYCLMMNHTHVVAVPDTAGSLRKAIGEAHRRYTSMLNARYHWTGHLWQGRFASYPLESTHYANAIRYIEQNPVRAGLVQQAWDYPWSSARARVLGDPDPLLCPKVFAMFAQDWLPLLATELSVDCLEAFRLHSRTGRPLGSSSFLQTLEAQTGRALCPQKPGPKPKGENRMVEEKM